jgi:hypothetical protein
MPVSSAYLSTQGYAKRVNRPKPVRVNAKTPFCRTVRLVGCPSYKNAAFYKVFYSYDNRPESFFKESWYVHKISTDTPHHVVPDASGFYPVLNPASDYFPYHTLINWRTNYYKNGPYKVHLALYDAGKNQIWPTGVPPYVRFVLDNSQPSKVDFLRLRWRLTGSANWINLPLDCPVIRRPAGADIDLSVTYNVVAEHLRDLVIRFYGCGQPNPLLNIDTYWHQNVGDNNVLDTWTIRVSGARRPGAYRFHLSGRSRAFNANGGLASNWYFDPLHIWRANNLPIAILDI